MAARVTDRPMPYTLAILRLAAAIPHQRPLDSVAGAELRSPACGARIRVAVSLDDGGRVAQLVQGVEACAFGQAAAAVMGAQAVGRSKAEAQGALTAIASWLDGGALPAWPGFDALDPVRALPGRHGAVVLPFRALVAAIEAAE